jgi:pSer/pThr/pTyr-binding forkhead associated (FHA) protein
LLRDTEEVLLVDLESTNGTWVNGVCVSPEAPVRLVDGDVIWLGQVVVRYAGAPAQRT